MRRSSSEVNSRTVNRLDARCVEDIPEIAEIVMREHDTRFAMQLVTNLLCARDCIRISIDADDRAVTRQLLQHRAEVPCPADSSVNDNTVFVYRKLLEAFGEEH